MNSQRPAGDLSDTQRHNPRDPENATKGTMAGKDEAVRPPRSPAAQGDEVSALKQVRRHSASVPTRPRRPEERNPELDKAVASNGPGARREPNAPQMQREDAGTAASGNEDYAPDGEPLRQAPLAPRNPRG